MSASTPREAVLASLSQPSSGKPVAPIRRGETRELTAQGVTAPIPVWWTGGRPYRVDLDTLRFVIERTTSGGRRFFVLTFEADHVRLGRMPMHSLVIAEPAEGGGWVARGIASGSGDGSDKPPSWTKPRVNLAGSWSQTGFRGGGRLHRAGADIARVRLTFTNGPSLEDHAESDWVFFLTEVPVAQQATVEMIDRAGAVVARHSWGLSPRPASV
jgi:hypothetical protein